MEGIVHGNDLEFAFFAAPFPGKFDQRFIGFGTAVAEEAHAVKAVFNQFLRQTGLLFVHVKIGDMEQFFRLFADCRRDRRVGMTEAADRDPGSQIQVLIAFCIPEFRAFTAHKKNVCTGISVHHIFIVQSQCFHRCRIFHDPQTFLLVVSFKNQ